MGQRFLFFAEDPHEQEAGGQEQHHEDRGADVERGTEAVHEETVDTGGKLGQVGDDAEEDDSQNQNRNGQHAHRAPERDGFLVFLVINQEDDRRYSQQVEQVYADRKTHQEADEHQPAVGVRLVGLLLPFERRPEHDGGKERGHGIDFTLYGREPERVGEAVGKGSDQSGAEKADGAGLCKRFPPFLVDASSEVDDGQVEEEDGEPGAKRAHGVDGDGGVLLVGKQREDAGEEVEDGVARRMADFQFVGRGDEFAAIPETGGGFYGCKINQRCEDGHAGRDDAIDLVELFFIHVYAIFP